MKKNIMNTKYIFLLLIFIGFTACNDPEDIVPPVETPQLPDLIAGEADFSKYVSIGSSLTAGFSDGALFKASQENSFPSILSQKLSILEEGNFIQPLMDGDSGLLVIGNTRIAPPRLVTLGGPPLPLESVIGTVKDSTDLAKPSPTGPFNNMGIPLAKSFHLLAPGYGNIANFPTAANPYFIRMTGATPDASVIELAMAQSPSFFSLWIGNNDVLGYATSGGDGTNPITDQPTFDFAISTLVSTLTSGGAKGVMANIPYVTDIAHFTTVPYNPVPLNAATAAALNTAYAQYNGGLQLALANGFIDALEAESRTIRFEASETNTMVLIDEDLTDLSGLGLPNYRQSTEDDLFVLPLSSLIPDGYGTAIPLEDKWVLIPREQDDIKKAIDDFNITIEAAATQAGLAFVDANDLLTQLTSTGLPSNNFILTSNLVTGGAFSLDGIHLTSRGYALIANEFMKAIDAAYGSNFEASGNLVDIGEYPTNYLPLLPSPE
ncbi:G-D-S-L family lipolytic protein [Tamlana sp. 2201CG12-4]|uniref:G-D-S-L family lipolytic protein n=1 Tax=Tamlana sp. 2201CG12-4 TaxID=3112582 RepID=UPI002DB83204|nr:G-D-S-L family lipolytic protein [Tamlana sp. 2201CG12-4]MEC3906472.1 G-D-S-L family lipolytic protein [Tamlana sp. 2201CG12-4]